MKKKRAIFFLALVIVVILIFLPGFFKYQKLLEEQKDLKLKMEELRIINRQLEEKKRRLESDIEYIEKRAREKLGVAKKGEVPYRIMKEE